MQELEVTSTFERAIDLIENGNHNVFVTGKAGTGKSTLLRYLKERTRKNTILLAPTGVAAVNIGGQTIHSFFHFSPSTTVSTVRRYRGNPTENIYKKIDAIIIDEISMVRADLLDCIDRSMRINGKSATQPFGGVQLIFFGDLYQLPPVLRQEEEEAFSAVYESPYFFSSHAFKKTTFINLELDKIYRQKDMTFIKLLNNIRHNQCISEDIKLLNSRVNPTFRLTHDSPYICLTPRNLTAQSINENMLRAIPHPIHSFDADIKGKVGRELYPIPEHLQFKVNARIMMVNNDPQKRWCNGTTGKVIEIDAKNDRIFVHLDDGESHWVKPHTWDIFKFTLEDGHIESETVGKFKQFPMTLAWAITIHKSQGKTFDHVLLDLKYGIFSPGQLYVALSRCTSLENIILTNPVTTKDIWTDTRVQAFI